MPHKPAKLLQDILTAGAAIQSFVESKTLEDYRQSLLLRSAVERQFEIIGEAMRRLGQLDRQIQESLPHHARIIAFRNIIAHGYDVLNPEIVWQIIHHDLPALLERAQQTLAELPD